ncbi:MAG: dipeptidase, partial [Candidatus Eisenbacteria bacterium]|nr:dipeptidase [Candidatus Eisenbacteria bacterium]
MNSHDRPMTNPDRTPNDHDLPPLPPDTLVFDGHADTLLGIVDKGHHIDRSAEFGNHIDLDRMAAGGLHAEIFTAFVDPTFIPGARDRAHRLIDALHDEARCFPGRLTVTTSADAVREAVAAGRVAAVPAIEGGHAIEDSLDNLREFHRKGIRLMTLTWNNSNNWADGCWPGKDDPRHGGLTDFGKRVIGEMEKLDILVDVSHASPETFRDVAAIATKPFVASHSGADAVTPHFRNLKDEQIDIIAKSGGLVGVPFVSGFLVDEFGAWKKVMDSAEYAALSRPCGYPFPFHAEEDEEVLYECSVPQATLDDFFRHLDYLVNRIGWQHVALGTDFDGTKRMPVEIADVADLGKVTRGLVARGYSAEA